MYGWHLQDRTWSRDKPSKLGADPLPLAVIVTPATSLKSDCGNVTSVGPAALSLVIVML